MAKRPHESGRPCKLFLTLLTVAGTCLAAYFLLSPLLPNPYSSQISLHRVAWNSADLNITGCCRGLEHTELWSEAVKWGSDFLLNSTQACCDACRNHPRCNSWVYCADQAKCGDFYRQCWLKKQKDPFDPEIHDSSPSNPWTSGLVFERHSGLNTVGILIDSGTLSGEVIHLELLPECSPKSVLHVLELVKLTHCTGCRFYRAEGRGKLWDSNGYHNPKMSSTGPPYAVVQGTLEAQHVAFKGIPKEYTPVIRRGMVGWVGEGPEFFISLADHFEWPRKHTVFATVAENHIYLLESLAELQTNATTWEGVSVQVLVQPINLRLQRVTNQ
ncbi:uncharacterized protein [Physcomitrium patens]|uniref:Uncharacterized protein n=1 Tax=Physcomitrium patens TaxID=3218 RepID=A9TEC1_PHYPA|nr:uncharacterized protein LOC112287003 isoform X1 [Physcomitrium patens]XP_024385337.1 uncharacterized protein LOC112287003 isoform X1 [Physcomitrium patens]XP_024385339.1 uncharacterized protein LOC112287003 isoform X1 [Physcomitrium patens]XP_024385340.1 uncharacterized protein LOC112287003 isoform X1 [Physcomitrium patens]XP_024385341.1 uncharacterized protein LOC112287003 isoform X1 [Physcomitrium patens]PNR47729.1 hypothetical protein PHYPA_012202 [Physcomitrium patens]|eukprot:XP_024385336.1 uncharacterized protein LOC112287003 isoform X1 [Physcomitrella patens]